MTDKEFRKLKRGDLVSIIYEYQKKQDELIAEIDELNKKIESREVKLSNAGSIAEAVVGMNGLFETAQRTADEYIEKVKISADKKAAEIIAEAEEKARKIIEDAEKKSKEGKDNVS